MSDGNFYETLRSRFDDHRAKPMLTTPGGASLTYGEMDARAAQMANVFDAAGLRPGDRILVQVEKSAENVAAYLGAMRAGLVYIPLNTAYTDEEVAYFLKDAEPSIFVCDPARNDMLEPVAARAGVETVFTLDKSGAGTLSDAANGLSANHNVQPRHGDDLSAILYTSGTTGRSKGAMLSHHALETNALALNTLWGVSENDVLLHALPIFHIHGLFIALHTAMLSACEMLFLPKFELKEVRRQLPRASIMMGVPTFYSRLLGENSFGRTEAQHMRLFISGSAPLTEEIFNVFAKRTGHKILERYGMSEAGMIASNPLDGERIAGTVGYALPGVEIRITNDDGDAVAPGEPGSVEIRGDSLFKGYWRMPEKTESEFRAGWFVTGDVGSLDEDGRLTLSGRSKDLIIAGGYNIYPKEIETVLDAVPGVVESAVIGVRHPDMGEGVVAVIVAEEGAFHEKASDEEAAVKKAIESLAKFKRPRRFFWVEALPRNAMGKVQKQVLREQFIDVFQD